MNEASPTLRAVPSGTESGAAPGHPKDAPETGITPPRRRAGAPVFLTDVMVGLGMLSRERVDAAIEEAKSSGQTPERILIESGALTGDQLARAIAERFGLDHVDLTVQKPDVAAINLINAREARRFEAVPIGFSPEGALMVAMADPANVLALDDLKLMTGYELRPLVASSEDISAVIGRMSDLDEAIAQAAGEEDEPDVLSDIRESADDAPVIKLVNSIVAQAVGDGASDIHFEPEGRDLRVRFRIDGVLAERTRIPRRMMAGVISRLKIMGELDISERRLPQDGRTGLRVGDGFVDIRMVTLPSVLGEGLSLRLLDKDHVLLELDTLGMADDTVKTFEAAFRQAYGAVLVTGPTGSGKSTTLYAALNAINEVDKKVLTIEDPVEYQIPGITQLQVHPKGGLSFAGGLRSMLRADPDIIMVGEIRDADTARIAIEAALTGHLMLSTLHTNDAPSAVTRLTEMGIEPFLTASALDCVVAQRLVRRLCTYCKERTMLSVDALEAAGFKAAFDLEAYEAVGCARCGHHGYRGRTGVYEVMSLSEEIRALTVDRVSADVIRATAVEQGMRPLREDGLEKVRLGVTSIAEVARVT